MAITLASAALIATTAPLAVVSGAPEAIPSAPQLGFAQEVQPAQPVEEPAQQDAAQKPVGTEEREAEANPATTPDSTIVVTGSSETRKKDPLVNVNETAFEITQSVDAALVEPLADAYEEEIPSPLRKGLRNFFRNLLEPVNALNYLLQLKPGKAFETIGRFTLNSTVGIGGLIDVAKKEPFNLPYRRNGFANTLGYYGVEPGPFLVLPLVGATTLRDLIGSGIDQSIVPFAVGKPFNTPYYAVPAYTVNSLEFRIEFDQQLEDISESDDPYFAMREIYLCQREADIAALKNRPPPRDCSIEAIMGLNADAIEALSTPEDTVSSAESADEVVAEPTPPAIQYVSNPVVQPLPADYSPAPAPTI